MQEDKPEIERKTDAESYYGIGSFLFEVVKIFLLALVIIVPVRVFLFQPFFVQGASMEPTFHDGEYLIINELGYKQTDIGIGENSLLLVKPFRRLERTNVVVFRYPKNPSQFFIKRIIALPGEKIEVRDGAVKIFNNENPKGFVLDETVFLSESVRTSGDVSITLGDEEYFVMGDNRQASHDSRSWGPLPAKSIIGKVSLRAWPINRFGLSPETSKQ